MNQNLEHYIAKHKEHELNKTSTNERNKYWHSYQRLISKFEHG